MCSLAATEVGRAVRPAAAVPSRGIIVVGVGNPILGDDGVGWRIAEALDHLLTQDPALGQKVGPVEIEELAVGGLQLMEHLIGYARAILVDASCDGRPPGTIWSAPIDAQTTRGSAHLDSAHDVSLVTAIAAGKALGAVLPESLHFVGVSVANDRVGEFSERLSAAVAAAVEPAVNVVVGLLLAAHDA